MPAAANNGFDGRIFAKLVALFDSPQEPEAAGALHHVRIYLKQHGGLAFYQAVERDDYKTAVWESFGFPECLREYFERKNVAGSGSDELRKEVGSLERKVTEVATLLIQEKELLIQEKELTAALRQELETLRRHDPGLVNGILVTLVVLASVVLLVASEFR